MNERSKVEDPMELVIKVVDQNDNAPKFTQSRFYGGVSESAEIGGLLTLTRLSRPLTSQSYMLFPTSGDSIMKVTAVDKDDPDTSNAIIRYQITAQHPRTSERDVFAINPASGVISVKASELDREVTMYWRIPAFPVQVRHRFSCSVSIRFNQNTNWSSRRLTWQERG